jgi:hypothetical protein
VTTITKGIPIPPKRSGRPAAYPIDQMQVGDSFVVEKKCRASVITSAGNKGVKVVTRVQPDGTLRVWRVE